MRGKRNEHCTACGVEKTTENTYVRVVGRAEYFYSKCKKCIRDEKNPKREYMARGKPDKVSYGNVVGIKHAEDIGHGGPCSDFMDIQRLADALYNRRKGCKS